MINNCYKYIVAKVPNIYGNNVMEILDISYTTMPEEGIIEYVNNVLRFRDYNIVYSPLPYRYFIQIPNNWIIETN